MSSRAQANYISAHKMTLSFWSKLGHKPQYQRLDNETSAAREQYAATNDVSIQYCPRRQHRFLKEDVSTLRTDSTDFPMNLWENCFQKQISA